jgi:superfamily II DNA or RNA helicase
MDDVVDVHTYYGREILGRGLAHFYDRGSKLNPDQWKPHPLEIESINDLRSKIKEPLVESSSPREYQGKLVSDTIKHLRDNRTGWLLMACGTGKTKTGHWVMQGLLDKGTSALVVVVTPFLHILRQFHASWAAMNRMHKIRSITGIVASCRDKYDKDDYSNYVYLAPSEVDKFVTSHTGIKFIFTTYSSLPKILHLKPMLTIYDEAHHAKSYKVFDSGMELFLTATPNKHYHAFGEIIARYNLREAVDNGYLTPYKIFVVRDPCRMSALEHIQSLAKKTIVYCSTNSEAKELHQLYSSSGARSRSFYIDCKSNQSDRDYIFSNYRKLDRAVIFNCAILGEGVDFTDCDSILISSGYVSSARVVQAMGRPLRLHEGKQCAYIFMMDDKNTSARIRAMEQYDPKVLSYLSWI